MKLVLGAASRLEGVLEFYIIVEFEDLKTRASAYDCFCVFQNLHLLKSEIITIT